jgi:hypothetical protein
MSLVEFVREKQEALRVRDLAQLLGVTVCTDRVTRAS